MDPSRHCVELPRPTYLPPKPGLGSRSRARPAVASERHLVELVLSRFHDLAPHRGAQHAGRGDQRHREPAPPKDESLMENLLETRSLFIHYRMRQGTVRAVENVNFALAPGEAVGLVGDSGCGKPALAKGILEVLPRYAEVRGQILFEGRDLASLPR